MQWKKEVEMMKLSDKEKEVLITTLNRPKLIEPLDFIRRINDKYDIDPQDYYEISIIKAHEEKNNRKKKLAQRREFTMRDDRNRKAKLSFKEVISKREEDRKRGYRKVIFTQKDNINFMKGLKV